MGTLKMKIITNLLDSMTTTNLTDIASDFESSIKIIANNKEADAKSLINVMALGISKDEIIEIIATGIDAIQALNEIKGFMISNKIAEIIE